MLKFASFEVLSAVMAPERGAFDQKQTLRTVGHRHNFEYEVRPGFLYVRSRAISSRCNDNFDEFPAEEIEKAYRTFIGKPVFVNHHNDNHRRARGVIIDAALHKDRNPDGSPDTWCEVLMEVDAVRFPKLAKAVIAGEIDRTSMGTDVKYSICSICDNKASTPAEYCAHIPKMKGKRFYRADPKTGTKVGVLCREICYGLGFFENSLLVEEPADPTAYFLGVDASGVKGAKTASKEYPRLDGVGLGQDEQGHYVQTHRARSDSYPSPEEIPDDVVDFIRSTGAKTAGEVIDLAEQRGKRVCPECEGDGGDYDGYYACDGCGGDGTLKAYQERQSKQSSLDAVDFFRTAMEIPLSGGDREFYRHMHDVAETNREMHQHGQQRVVNLADPHDLKAHLFEAHGWDDGDLWRNSHPEDHPALMGATDEDRLLSHQELRDAHQHEHEVEYPDDYRDAVTMGDSHFHTARKTASSELPEGAPEHAVAYNPHDDQYWVKCDQGHTHYGAGGAAGLLLRHTDETGTKRYYLQKRADWVDHGGTYSVPGGALHHGEDPVLGAEREAEEEMGALPEIHHSHTISDDHGKWGYHTVVADVDRPFHPAGRDSEHAGGGWFTKDEMSDLPLHPGFKATMDQTLAEPGNSKEAAKPKKPVGQMTPEEYEAHVSAREQAKTEGEAWNRKNPVRIKHVLAHWNAATDDEKATGEAWYADAHHMSKHIASDTNTPMHVMAGLMSNYSPQTHWAANIQNAARVARTKTALGGKGSGVLATENQKKAAQRMLDGEHYDKVLAGPKTRAFAHLIEHGGNADPEDPKVVIDRHALSVAAGARATDNAYMHSRLGTKGRYNEVSQVYHKAAKVISKQEGRPIAAHQVQAATWLVRQRLNEEHDRALSKTAGSRSATAARRAVAEWNSYAAEHHPAVLGKEPGTGYSQGSSPEPDDVQHAKAMEEEGKSVTKAGSREAFQRLADMSRRLYSDHPSGYRAEWKGGPRFHIYEGDVPVASPTIPGYSDAMRSSEVEDLAGKFKQKHLDRGLHDWVSENGEETSYFNHPDIERPSYADRAFAKDMEQGFRHRSTRHTAYGETKAPADVDTLRDDTCPVCGESDSYDGSRCQVCGYDAPPAMFRDPDLNLAQQVDLRKDVLQDAGTLPGQDGANGGLPGAVPGEGVPGTDQVLDPEALGANGQPGQDPNDPSFVDPNTLGADGQPLVVDPALAPDVDMAGAQQHMNVGGEPFTPGPNAPTPAQPLEPGAPGEDADDNSLDPEDLDANGEAPVDPDRDGDPGTPEDGVPDLVCPNCGFQSDAAQPQSVDMDDQALGSDDGSGTLAGDVCPNCGQAQLLSAGEMEQMMGQPERV